MALIVPPGGFAGFAQMTQASRAGLSQGAPKTNTGKRTNKRRRKSTKAVKAKATRRKSKRAKAKRPARLVKGSAAAKAYMAKIRKKRK